MDGSSGAWMVRTTRAVAAWICILLGILRGNILHAQDMIGGLASADLDLRGLEGVLREALLRTLPDAYENDKQWNKQKTVKKWDVSRDGLRLRLEPHPVQVRHGTWVRYVVRFVDPERTLELKFLSPETPPDGMMRVPCELSTRLELFARVSQWWKDVQLYSINLLAEADVRVQIRWRLGWKWLTGVVPGVPLVPIVQVRAESAELQLMDFRLKRISQLHGVMVRPLSEVAEDWLRSQLPRWQGRLVEKLNERLERWEQELTERVSLPWRDKR